MILDTRELLCREREPERRWPQVERQHVEARRQQVERWQPGVLSRNYQSSPQYHVWGVFDSNPFFQPPIMRPNSFIFSDIAIYFLLSKARSSHETRRKNFKISVFFIAESIVGNFSSFFW